VITWRHALDSAPTFGPCVLTLGNFDGVHTGHKRLLHDTRAAAQRRGIPSAVLSFDPHPSVVVAPERRPRLLMTLAQRLAAFETAGMDLAWIVPFSRDFSELSPEEFLEGLARALRPAELHAGKAFRFGRHHAGDIERLRAWAQGRDCAVHAHALKAPDGGPLSSTRIREALNVGRVEEAALFLGHPYALTGIIVEGDRRGRHLGFPTANLAWEQEQLPASGVYVTKVKCPHLGETRLGLTNVGEKPTFAGLRLTVEVHIPGYEGDLYGAHLELGFLHRLREEQRFVSVDALRAQIAEDVIQGAAWWEDHRGGGK
jgi:riboflavin kinase/FMN adenylyltransferase